MSSIQLVSNSELQTHPNLHSPVLSIGEGQKGTPGRGRDRKCHDRESLSRPLVLSLGFLTSLTSLPLFCTSEDINGRGGGSHKMALEGKGTDLS